ncbi:MAG: hypothetical protein SFY67_11715 [Candidatus Melainabacteria bacterium]|nr:hypothetical protein [Candidatus Melainabacteria bacterium]
MKKTTSKFLSLLALAASISVNNTIADGSKAVFAQSKVKEAPKDVAADQFNWAGVPAFVDVSTRISSLDKEITHALGEERLTKDQAQQLKGNLDRVAQLNNEFTQDGKLTIWERVRLILDLDKLSQDLEIRLAKRKTAITDLSGKQDQLEKEIAEDFLSGRLTNSQAAKFKTRLQSIKDKEKGYRQDAKLSQAELLALSYDLDQLNLDLEKNLRVRSIAGLSIDARLDRLKNRKNNLVKNKRLDQKQVAEINASIEKIEKEYASFKTSDKKLDPKEVLNLALELDKIGSRLSELAPGEVSSAIKSIDSLQSEIRTMLDNSKVKNTLTVQQLDQFKQENSRIETLESLFKADNSFSDSEILTVVRELETLKQQLTEASKSKGEKIDLQTKIDLLRKRVKEVSDAKRFKQGLSAQEIDKGIDSIEKKLKVFKQDNELSDSESLAVSSELDALNSKLESSLQNLPDVQERKVEIERRLNEALASNRVAIKKAEELRREGSRISFMETVFKRDGILSDQDIVKLSEQYDNLEKKLAQLLPPLPDIEKLQNQVTTKLEEAKAKGSIPKAKLEYLTDEMDRINSIGSSFKASDDRLSDWEIMALKADLEKLEKDIDKSFTGDQVKKQ